MVTELGVDYAQVERPDGTIQYYVKPTNYKKKKATTDKIKIKSTPNA